MKKMIVLGLAIGLCLMIFQSAWGDETDNEQVYAVQNRIFHRYHEIGAFAGYIADDDFFHIYPVSLGYTFNFKEHFSWEVARFQYMITQEKDLKAELLDIGVQPSRYPEQQYALHSHLIFRPFYGKDAVLNRGIVNRETYFFIGGGATHYEWNRSFGENETENAPSLSFGVGMKYFLNQKFCLNFEIRDMVTFREDDTENNIHFGIGIGFRFDLSARKSQEDPTIQKLKGILND
ncbi:MAG: outer membrane beta-barrel domain-containing protein [Deltaproteobacteria bacterium]|nr:outer membrane beta-barrel domain-containing protein [Deltaproteobacteria bacterium]